MTAAGHGARCGLPSKTCLAHARAERESLCARIGVNGKTCLARPNADKERKSARTVTNKTSLAHARADQEGGASSSRKIVTNIISLALATAVSSSSIIITSKPALHMPRVFAIRMLRQSWAVSLRFHVPSQHRRRVRCGFVMRLLTSGQPRYIQSRKEVGVSQPTENARSPSFKSPHCTHHHVPHPSATSSPLRPSLSHKNHKAQPSEAIG